MNAENKNTSHGAINLAVELGSCLERAGGKPLFAQLYSQICHLILNQRLSGGEKLPSSRAMATDLGLSRTTVVSAYEQLEAEGYIEARRGAGVFVVEGLSEGLFESVAATARPLSVPPGKEITT